MRESENGKYLTVVDGAHAEAINALRRAEYGDAPGFKVDAPGILWNRSDDQCTVLAAFDGGELISTMRIELVDNQELVERKMECPWSFPVALRYPVMILSKAATRKSHRAAGLNALMRFWALRFGCEWQVKQVIGTFVSGSPREKSMRQMGYQFFVNEQGWFKGDYHSENPVLVALLDLETDGEQAVRVCGEIAKDAVEAYPWKGSLPGRKFVQVVK